jgi:hypothetical protein
VQNVWSHSPTVQLAADALVSHAFGAYGNSSYRKQRDLNGIGIRLGSDEEARTDTTFAQLISSLKAKIEHLTTMKNTFRWSQSNSEIPTQIDDKTIRACFLSCRMPLFRRTYNSRWTVSLGLYTYSFHTSSCRRDAQ